ncbi:ATP-binding protein [Teredinibacter purpureus]|uniref:ATP-binding protein n=1 Tax=Teredinibacter purpureus TaxID=2731756 RepID=UPI0005F7C8E5|nr:ATP-binding protein [Teredinibacter purpureus]
MSAPKIRPKVRDGILRALSAGVVPSQGIQYIQVGRAPEIKAMIRSIESIADGSSVFKMVVGDYGSGKTFFMHLVRKLGFEKKLVTMHADFSPERRLVASGGQARNLYSELVSNLSTRSRPDGGALPAIIDMFVGDSLAEASEEGVDVETLIDQKLSPLRELVAGYDFARVIGHYCRAHEQGNDALKQSALRWLKGEFSAKTDARNELGDVRTIIEDKTIYDAIKLLSKFLRIAGQGGLLVMLDEAVNLFKITHAQSRTSNYELVLTILNDTLQSNSSTEGLGVLIGITPEALFDPRRGLCSYDALASRLSPNRFAEQSGLVDYNQPTIHLQNLTPEELYLLLSNIRNVFAAGEQSTHLITDEGLKAFMDHCQKTIGSAYFKTPRETIRGFVNLLSMLDQYPDKSWTDFIDQIQIDADPGDDTTDSDDLKSFTL